jgi:hypothetical protein
MFLDQRRTRAENGRKGQKNAANEWSVAAADEAGEDSHGTAEREPDQIFVPASFLQKRRRKSDRTHV